MPLFNELPRGGLLGTPYARPWIVILLQLGFAASWQFLRVGSYHNILWSCIKSQDLGRDAGG